MAKPSKKKKKPTPAKSLKPVKAWVLLARGDPIAVDVRKEYMEKLVQEWVWEGRDAEDLELVEASFSLPQKTTTRKKVKRG